MNVRILYRDIEQSTKKAKAIELTTILDLEKIPESKVFSWQDSESLCIVDIDYHGVTAPDHLSDKVKYIYPQPSAYEISQRGGLHLYYVQTDKYSAIELASVAYFSAQAVYMTCTGIEVLTKSRRCGELYILEPTTHVCKTKLFDLFGRCVTPEDIARVKEKFGYGRVSTNLCPFTRHNVQHDTNPSVQVSDRGVTCYRCNKTASFEALASATGETQLKRYTQNMVWWDLMSLYLMRFVRYDLRSMHQEQVSRAAYSALLTALHKTNDYRRHWALDRLNLYRHNNLWVSKNGVVYKDVEKRSLVKLIPSLNTGGYKKDKDGEIDYTKPFARGKSINLVKASEYLTDGERLYDIPQTVVSQGVSFSHENIMPDDDSPLRVYHQNHQYENFEPFTATAEQAINALDTLSKEINIHPPNHIKYQPIPPKNLIQLILAQAFAEYEGEKPILVATGVSGSGKTVLPRLASAILRSRCVVCDASYNKDQRLEAFGMALFSGCKMFVSDEALKHTSPVNYLNMNASEAQYRIIYIGFQTIKSHCATVLTGITLPKEFRENGQFMRRVTMLPKLSSSKLWNAGTVTGTYLKDPIIKEACDTLLSYLLQFMPDTEETPGTFREFWSNIEPELHSHFTEGDADEYDFDSPAAERFDAVYEFLKQVNDEGSLSKTSKYREAKVIQKNNRDSKAWATLKSLFLNHDLTRELPPELHDYFSEFDLSEFFKIKDFAIQIDANSTSLIVRMKSGKRLVPFRKVFE